MSTCRTTLPADAAPTGSPNVMSEDDPVIVLLKALHERLDRLEQNLAMSREKEAYTVDEAAKRLNRRPWTVRQWCNKGEVAGAYKVRGKGRTGEWRIPHDALVRVQNEGAAPVKAVG